MKDETNKPILKVGDKIRIKSKEWFDSQPKNKDGNVLINGSTFFTFMAKYCGEECIITSIHKYTEDCTININDFIWYPWMFDIVESAHEYKVGDKVRIKSKEWFNSQYKSNREDIEPPEGCNRPFFDFMEQYCGNICTIKYIYSNNAIKFNENDEDWESWMFDLVDEDKIEVGDLVTTSEEQLSNNKDNDSQSNSSKFDLSRVIYRSRRIK